MSHFKERKSKSCLNCNAEVYDRFCGVCGQENIEPQESVFHLFKHFFEDITHFDGKFFTSVKYLLTKPGHLTREYEAGRRLSYLNPVRFYIFTSFLFFLIMFTFLGNSVVSINTNSKNQSDTFDFTPKNKYTEDEIEDNKPTQNKGFIDGVVAGLDSSKNNSVGVAAKVEYKNRKEFDSLDKIGKIDASFLRRKFINKNFDLKEKFGNDKTLLANSIKQQAVSLLPQTLLLSLPFFALILTLLYVRQKKYFYVSHIIFTIHFYIFVYIQVLLINISNKVAIYYGFSFLKYISILLALIIPIYMYKAMRNFYEQRRLKTIFKLLILSFFLLFLFSFFLLFLIGLSFYKS